MSQRLFDDLARALASPMPRRQALRVVAAAVAGAMVGGLRPPLARAADRDCTDQKICFAGTDTCFTVCCPPDRVCCLGPAMNETGCPTNPHCCNPCNPTASQCQADGSCGPGPVAADCACEDGRPYCGGTECCEPGQECVDGRCACPRGTRRCGSGCCPVRWECVDDGLCCEPNGFACNGACCKQRDRCVRGKCVPRCPNERSPCGPRCCARGERCVDARAGVCAPCPGSRAPCGGRCCAAGSYCCDPYLGLCCEEGSSCSRPIEGRRHCCRTQWCETSSGGRCCPDGTRCLPPWDGGVRRSDPRVCCPPARQASVFAGPPVACCPEGSAAIGGNQLIVGGGALGICCPNDQLCEGAGRRTCCPKSALDGTIAACCDGRCCRYRETCCSGSCCAGVCCDGECRDPLTDPKNCGGCGTVCPSGRCEQGVCV